MWGNLLFIDVISEVFFILFYFFSCLFVYINMKFMWVVRVF